MHEGGSSKVLLIQFINRESPCNRVHQKSFQQNDLVRLRSGTSDIVTMTQSVNERPHASMMCQRVFHDVLSNSGDGRCHVDRSCMTCNAE